MRSGKDASFLKGQNDTTSCCVNLLRDGPDYELRTCTSKFTCTSTTFNDHCRLTTNACNFNILKKKSHQAKTSLWTLSGRIEHTRIWVRNRSIIGPKAVSMCIAHSSWTLQCQGPNTRHRFRSLCTVVVWHANTRS